MSEKTSEQKRITDLENRVKYLEEINRLTLDALDQAVLLGDFQTSINKLHSPAVILEETRSRIHSLIPFEAISFYLVDESNSEFYLYKCDPESLEHNFQAEVDRYIEDGSFAWALRERHPIFLYTRDKKKKILLHVMTTASRIRGMFAGLLTRGEMDVPLISLSLVSIILRHSANALESYELYSMIKEINQNLESMVEDRTRELESSREQLRHAQKMEALGRLAGGVAHDFNNILTAISIASEISMLYPGLPEKASQKFKEIIKLSERATNLTRQLLAVSRKQIMVPKIIDISEQTIELGKMLRRLITEDIELVVEPGQNLPRIKADPGQVEQILMNLTVNARDAIDDQPNPDVPKRITIKISKTSLGSREVFQNIVAKTGPYIFIQVSDTGVGMDIDIIGKIFEPFYTTKKNGRGTGLGLATVYGIIKQNNGGITVQTQPGKGTTFNIYWPCAEPATEQKTTPMKATPHPKGNETILLAEDDKDIRKALEELLVSLGYSVLAASNGKFALELAKKHPGPIHLVVTDVMMPVMGGRKLADALREKKPTLRIIFTTGYTDEPLSVTENLPPYSRFIQKPYSINTITKMIRQLLDESYEQKKVESSE